MGESDNVWLRGTDSCPVGLLWVKKFGQGGKYSVASIDKNGKGGLMFKDIQGVSVKKDNYPLSRKQKKGKFGDSFTFVLHSIANGTKREILFRCISKEEVFDLSAGFQVIIDRIQDIRANKQDHPAVRQKKKTKMSIDALSLASKKTVS